MLKHFIRRSEGIRRESVLGSPLREICTAGSDRGARYKPPLGARPQASTDQVDPVRCEKCGGVDEACGGDPRRPGAGSCWARHCWTRLDALVLLKAELLRRRVSSGPTSRCKRSPIRLEGSLRVSGSTRQSLIKKFENCPELLLQNGKLNGLISYFVQNQFLRASVTPHHLYECSHIDRFDMRALSFFGSSRDLLGKKRGAESYIEYG